MSKNVLVTGVSQGMGFQVIKKHLELGDRVIGLAHSKTQELADLREKYGDNLEVYFCELTDTAEVNSVFSKITWEHIDILYNVAGLYLADQNVGLSQSDPDGMMKMYDVNAVAPLRVLQGALPLLRKGSIVFNVSSEAGSIGQAGRQGEYGYCMSKAALNMASKLFANSTKEQGIRTFCYHPGWLRTQMGGEGAANSPYSISSEEAADRAMRITAEPDKIPEEVMFLDYEGNYLPW